MNVDGGFKRVKNYKTTIGGLDLKKKFCDSLNNVCYLNLLDLIVFTGRSRIFLF